MEKEQIKQIRSIIEELQISPKEYRIFLTHKDYDIKKSLSSLEDVVATNPTHIVSVFGYDIDFTRWDIAKEYKLLLCEIHNPDSEEYYERLFLSIDLETMEQTKLDIRINE
jgi:hypothetical protein